MDIFFLPVELTHEIVNFIGNKSIVELSSHTYIFTHSLLSNFYTYLTLSIFLSLFISSFFHLSLSFSQYLFLSESLFLRLSLSIFLSILTFFYLSLPISVYLTVLSYVAKYYLRNLRSTNAFRGSA